MTQNIRIIPCLDIANGRVVKGVNFVDIKDAGDPVETALKYEQQGADELTFLDITATNDKRETIVELVQKVVAAIKIPLTVGGGVRSLEDIETLLNAGVSKVSISSAAIANPDLIKQASSKFGADKIIVAIDAKATRSGCWNIASHGGKTITEIDAVEWAKKMADFGAGELLVTSMDKDGTRSGFDLELTSKIAESVKIPVIASGGVGNLQHLVDGVKIGKAQGVLAASIFHFGEFTIAQAKQALADNGIKVA